MATLETKVVSTDANLDPITDAPGAHPIGVGIGAVAGGMAAGAVAGTVLGPVGTVVGAAVGAVAGGLAGKGVAEVIDPTVEVVYWRENFSSRPYAANGALFDDFAPAYVYGADRYSQRNGRSFDQMESDLRRDWNNSRGSSKLEWDRAKQATRDSWDRLDARFNG